MAEPKKRTGHSAQGHRRSNWKATKPETTKCPNCGETKLAHTVCTACGYYKGKAVSIKSPDYVETVVEKKKPAKKASKKAVKEETKAEEKVLEAEETKVVEAEEAKAEVVDEEKVIEEKESE